MKNVLYILGKLSDSDIEWLINSGSGTWIKPGENLIEEGKTPENIFILLEGGFDVIVKALDNKVLAQLGPGEVIGEMSFVEPYPPFATVQASEEGFLLKISREILRKKVEQDEGFASRFYFAIAVMLADRLRGSLNVIRSAHEKQASETDDMLEPDELDLDSLGDFSQAGARFDRIVKRVKGIR